MNLTPRHKASLISFFIHFFDDAKNILFRWTNQDPFDLVGLNKYFPYFVEIREVEQGILLKFNSYLIIVA